MPETFKELLETATRLEQHFKDMQDIEFTIEQRKLYMLQTRNGKRTAMAGIRVALDMVKEGMIDEATALQRINADDLVQLLAPIFDPKEKKAFEKAGQAHDQGPQRWPRRCHRPHRPLRRRGPGDGPVRPGGAGAPRDFP